jgi:hypothetical protein
MIKVVLLMIMTASIVYGFRHESVLELPYGTNRNEVGYGFYDEPDECFAIPLTFYIVDSTVVIQDHANKRTLIIRQYDAVDILRDYMFIKKVLITDSIIVGERALIRILPHGSKTIFILESKRERFRYFVSHPLGYAVGVSNHHTYYFDSSYTNIRASHVPSYILNVGVMYFADKKAMISDCFGCLKNNVRKHYHKLAGLPQTDSIPEVFAFPDSSEWGVYFSRVRGPESMSYLGVDTAYNTYWSTGRHSPEDSMHLYDAVFSYDRLGKLRFWFPEPLIEEGWMPYCGDIVVNEEGRIFKMVFYSKFKDFRKRIRKDPIDPTKGIRIIEYIPDEKDFTHQGRMERYGVGKKQ